MDVLLRFDEIPPDLLDYFESVPDIAPMSDVWKLSPEPLSDAHYAAYPTEIARRAILAGTSAVGCCAACGAPHRRVTTRERLAPAIPSGAREVRRWGAVEAPGVDGTRHTALQVGGRVTTETTGWAPTCACQCPDTVPATVLDPFAGSFTTVLVADRLGRHGIGIELSEAYVAMGRRRLEADAPMVAAVAQATATQTSLFEAEGA